jgi:multiple sugar transport system substrate-binding protein
MNRGPDVGSRPALALRGSSWAHARGHDPLVATAAEYERRTSGSVAISWEPRSLYEFGVTPAQQLAADYDLLVIDHPHVGDVAATGCLVAIDTVASGAEVDQLAADSIGGSFAAYTWDGHVWALPVDAAAQVSVYHPDRLPGGPPASWAAVADLADQGLVLWPLSQTDAFASFLTLAANNGTPCGAAPPAFIGPEAGRAVLAAMQGVARRLPEACLEMNPIAALDGLAEADQTAAYCPLLFGYSNYSRAGFRGARLRFADIPALAAGGPVGSLLGGVGLAVSAGCRDRGAAVRYAMWAASAATQRGIWCAAGGQPASASAWDDACLDQVCGGFFSATRRTLDASWTRPRHPGYPAFQEWAMGRLHSCLTGSDDPAALFDDLNGAYEASLASAGGVKP